MHASDIWILARGRLEVWPRGLALRPPWLCGTRALTAITMLTSFQLAAAEFREPQWLRCIHRWSGGLSGS